MQRHFLFALLFLICAGCALTPRQPTGVPANVDLAQLDSWQAHGRLGISGPETGGSGSFDWQQSGDRTDLQIRGPVGVGSVRLQLRLATGASSNPPTPGTSSKRGSARPFLPEVCVTGFSGSPHQASIAGMNRRRTVS